MTSLQNFDYNGNTIQRREDGFINLTQMCKANDKRIDHWKDLKATESYIKALQENYPESRVVYTEEGANGGTWGHPSLAINLARWISPKFAVWCDAHIFKLMNNGHTSLIEEPQPRSLPQRDTVDYIEAAEKLNNFKDGILKQLLQDALVEELSMHRNAKALPSANEQPQYTIVKIRARALGYSHEQIKQGSALGTFVAKRVTPAFSEQVGRYPTKHYVVSDELDNAIHQYFKRSHSLSK